MAFLAVFIIRPLYNYGGDAKSLRRFPSVPIASLTNAWGFLHQLFHSRTLAIHDAHKKYGKIVRVGPTHVSMAAAQAVKDIYGHGTPERRMISTVPLR